MPNASQLQNAPTQMVIGANTFRLDSYFWRNAMPQVVGAGQTPDPRGPQLQAKITVHDVNGRNIPADIKVAKMWVSNGSESIALQFTCAQPGGSQIMCRFDNGPAWATGTMAYAFIALVDAAGTQYLLQGQPTKIIQTS
jgi:hypothetical protein